MGVRSLTSIPQPRVIRAIHGSKQGVAREHPKPSAPSLPRQTSTTTIHAQCSPPDLNQLTKREERTKTYRPPWPSLVKPHPYPLGPPWGFKYLLRLGEDVRHSYVGFEGPVVPNLRRYRIPWDCPKRRSLSPSRRRSLSRFVPRIEAGEIDRDREICLRNELFIRTYTTHGTGIYIYIYISHICGH